MAIVIPLLPETERAMHCLLLILRGLFSFIGIKLSPNDLCLSFRSNSDSLTRVVYFRQDAVEQRKSSLKWLVQKNVLHIII